MTQEGKKIRVLLTKSRIDGHDRGVRYIAWKLRDAGMEVIFTRYGVAEDIVQSALQEDVDAIGISFSVGGHLLITRQVIELLQKNGVEGVPIFVGGIIPEDDVPELMRMRVGGAFGPGSYADEVIRCIQDRVAAGSGL